MGQCFLDLDVRKYSLTMRENINKFDHINIESMCISKHI